MTYQIEDNIPLPIKGGPQSNSLQSTLKRMEVSQSLLVAGKTRTSQVAYAVNKARGGSERIYYSRVVDGGVRIWRVQ